MAISSLDDLDTNSPPLENVVRFRKMCEDDVEHVHKNEIRSYEFPWTPGLFRDCLQGRQACWVVEYDKQVVGHGIFSVAVGEAHLLNICIARDWQGRGWGREFARHLVAEMKMAGAMIVFLEVRPSNKVAATLYDSMGFNEVGRRPNYYPSRFGHEDARVLALDLNTGWP